MVARFQDGWLHVIWKWNKSICGGVDGEKYKSMMGEGGGVVGMGCGGGRGGGVYCLLEVPEGCNCQVNVLQCTIEGVETVVGKYIRRKSVSLGYCSWEKAVFVVVVGG